MRLRLNETLTKTSGYFAVSDKIRVDVASARRRASQLNLRADEGVAGITDRAP